jgi:hypothetical protein
MSKNDETLKEYTVTRLAEDSNLDDSDFAFIFDIDGDIRCIQLPYHLSDNDELPLQIDSVLKLITEFRLNQLKNIKGRTYH